jgi:Gpi18-like mannosyltransferase
MKINRMHTTTKWSLRHLAAMDGVVLFMLLLLSRVPILLLFILSDWAIRDYDTSTAILGQLFGFRGEVDRYCGDVGSDHAVNDNTPKGGAGTPSSTFADSIYDGLVGGASTWRWREAFRGLRHWDGIHFTHIAHEGYQYEHQCAFFPGMPLIIRGVHEAVGLVAGKDTQYFYTIPTHQDEEGHVATVTAVGFKEYVRTVCKGGTVTTLAATPTTSPSPALLSSLRFVGDMSDLVEDVCLLVLTISAYAGAGVCLRRLTTTLLLDKQRGGILGPIARHFKFHPSDFTGAVVLLYVVSSTGVFTCALYTEAPFALLSLFGLCLRQSNTSNPTMRPILVSVCFMLGGLFRSNALLLSAFFMVDAAGVVVRCIRRGRQSVPSSIGTLLVLALSVGITLSPYLWINWTSYHTFHNSIDDGMDTSSSFPHPSWFRWVGFYGYLQKRYWNVGFLSAYTLKNAPNFIIPLPLVIFLVVAMIRWASLPRGILVKTLLDAHVATYIVMLLFAATSMHVQVLVRFLYPTPVTYWLLATLLLSTTGPRLQEGRGGSNVVLGWYASFEAALPPVLLAWSLTWIVVGTVAFSNHFPWT